MRQKDIETKNLRAKMAIGYILEHRDTEIQRLWGETESMKKVCHEQADLIVPFIVQYANRNWQVHWNFPFAKI